MVADLIRRAAADQGAVGKKITQMSARTDELAGRMRVLRPQPVIGRSEVRQRVSAVRRQHKRWGWRVVAQIHQRGSLGVTSNDGVGVGSTEAERVDAGKPWAAAVR